MYGFRMAQLPAPEYTILQRLRKDLLGDGCTQRAAIATALRVTAEVVRDGGAHRVVRHYDEFQIGGTERAARRPASDGNDRCGPGRPQPRT